MDAVTPGMTRAGAEYQVGDAISGRWLVRSICGGLGRSGMGIVYVVDDRLSNETVAVKTLQPHLVADAHLLRLLNTEANLWLAMGRHPNIVALRYVESQGAQLYLYMDYVEPDANSRNCLTHFLLEQPLDNAVIGKWALQTCAALLHMQSCGIQVHRDLKPDNVMIDRAGTVRVTDFGLAHGDANALQLTSGERIPGITVIGGVVGTPGYIAPELVAGDSPSAASDIYAFGLILVQMITGKPWAPFTAQWRGDVLTYEQETLRIRESLEVTLPGSPFAAVATRCLEFDPSRRYGGFAEIAAALSAACAAHGIGVDVNASLHTQAVRQFDPLNEVHALYGLGRYKEALDLVCELRRNLIDDPYLITCEGAIRTDMNDAQSALPLLRRACELAPTVCSYWNNLGRALRKVGESAHALQAFERAIQLDPAHANLWASKGNCLYDLGRFQEALASYEHAVALDRYFSTAHWGRACSLEKLGRLVDALSALETVLDIEPDNREARVLFDNCIAALRAQPLRDELRDTASTLHEYYRQHRFEDCLRIVREARFRHGDTADSWNDEGIFLTDLKDYRGALRCFDFVLQQAPERCNTWTNKGRVYRRLKQLQEAVYCHDRAATLQPQEPIPWFNKYTCYRELGLEVQAVESFRNACVAARSWEHKEMCRLDNPDLYYLTMAAVAYNAKDYAEAHRCAASVAAVSRYFVEAGQTLARARFYLAMQFVEKDLAGEAMGFASAAHALSLAGEQLSNEEERNTVRAQLEQICLLYVNTAYAKLVALPSKKQAQRLLLLCVQHCQREDVNSWARRELSVLYANEAVEGINEANRLTDNLYTGKA